MSRLLFPASITKDLAALDDAERERAQRYLTKIDDDPIAGAPLFEPLRGLWSFRREGLRIVYRIAPEAKQIVVLSIRRAPPLD